MKFSYQTYRNGMLRKVEVEIDRTPESKGHVCSFNRAQSEALFDVLLEGKRVVFRGQYHRRLLERNVWVGMRILIDSEPYILHRGGWLRKGEA